MFLFYFTSPYFFLDHKIYLGCIQIFLLKLPREKFNWFFGFNISHKTPVPGKIKD